MLRVIALVAAVATAGTLAGTASAHPPDLYDSTGSYGTTYATQPYYGGTTYGTSAYVAPSYTGTTSYGSTYASPSYNATPIYSNSYTTPSYTTPSYTAPSYTAPSYTRPSYGYGYGRNQANSYHRGYPGSIYLPTRNAYSYRPLPRDRHRSFGPASSIPTTEGLNVGYAGGPTFGTDSKPVINGVSLNGAPD